jgi:adenine-specific DNA-methyltransferase
VPYNYLAALDAVLAEHGVLAGHAVDAFAGTASVGRFLKSKGFRVTSADIMTYSHVLQRAYIETDVIPQFDALTKELGLDSAPASVRHRGDVRHPGAGRDRSPGTAVPASAGMTAVRHPSDIRHPGAGRDRSPGTAIPASAGMTEVQAIPAFAGMTGGQAVPAFAGMTEVQAVPAFAGMTEGQAVPAFAGMTQGDAGMTGVAGDAWARLISVLNHLETEVPARFSLITNEYAGDAADCSGKRMYFTTTNASRIDAVRETLQEWRDARLINETEECVLLASLIEGLDAVANTTGVYAAYVKSWQSNALKPIRLRVPELITGTALDCRAMHGNINDIAATLGSIDLLYLDPPYNSRQYSGYYHIPELVAQGWAAGAPELRGKTGLIPNADKRSQWSTRGGCVEALNNLLDSVDAKYVLMSYNSEGIIPEDEICRAFISRGKPGTFRIHEHDYSRYRSDRDRTGRQYKSSRVMERAYFVELKRG